MPNYNFEHVKNKRIRTVEMKMAELDQFLVDHPNLRQVFVPPNVVDPAGIGVLKPPVDFQKYVLGPMRDKIPESVAVASRRWDVPKEI